MRYLGTILTGFLGGLIAVTLFHFYFQSEIKQMDGLENKTTHSNIYSVNIDEKEPLLKTTIPQLTDAAQLAIDAVVYIKIVQVKERYRTYYDPFRKFLGKNPYYKQRMQDDVKLGSGSGVIIDDNGYILTNNHVINGASKIEVKLNDNRIYEATIVGTDPNTDLAVLKIDETNLSHLPFGDSERLKVGEWVLAVGNPFNLTSTVTAGIISAKGRSINLSNKPFAVESFIQTDAAINPGNSGGALVNQKGELIGINTAISSHTGSYEGYAFAVPSNIARNVARDLIDFGKHRRVLMGFQCRTMDKKVSDHYALDYHEGIIIEKLDQEGNARKGGIQLKDIITKIGNKKIHNVAEIQESMLNYRPGDQVVVSIIRESEPVTLKFTLK